MAGLSGIVEAVGRAELQRSIVWPALIGIGFAVLAACAEKPPLPAPQQVAIEPPPPPLSAPRPHRVFRLPARKPTPPPESTANPSDNGAETTALAAVGPPPPHTSELIGLDQPAAQRLLGSATEKAEAPPATIWRYRNASCELDLFFYLDLRSGKMRTLHYAFKGDQGSTEDCLRALVIARRT